MAHTNVAHTIAKTVVDTFGISWRCRPTWRRASYNTSWCLLGCAIGDLGTILFFQVTGIPWPVWAIMSLAILNGLLTSIALETVILSRQMPLRLALTGREKGPEIAPLLAFIGRDRIIARLRGESV